MICPLPSAGEMSDILGIDPRSLPCWRARYETTPPRGAKPPPRLTQGEADGEAAAAAGGALFEGERAVVGENDGTRDGEAEAGAARLAGPRGVQAHERLEDALAVGCGDADP